ncbi:30S ribosomal protein S16 [Candidatus Phytoplasma pini]|uniref:Small ribosomal subunit protein bS16 n=1 Tax=Candidatus Phytoplasma pini TaxID=267362 RepID=A0A559KJ11_9MOLU|nr:30S ribosomal protein S16 [Candidatus Phytoplasma pini]TVY12116.1 30S ribosomal protein S16 [Candidatus Phytoplasma pini]
MSVKIRLKRLGSHKRPFYQIVTMNSDSKRDGKFLDILGNYEPLRHEININYEKVTKWLSFGAQPTATVKNLLKKGRK